MSLSPQMQESIDLIKKRLEEARDKHNSYKKKVVQELAKRLESLGYPIDLICELLCKELSEYIHDQYIRECLEDKYKRREKVTVKSYGSLRGSRANDANKDHEQKPVIQVPHSGGTVSIQKQKFTNTCPYCGRQF